MQSSFRALSDRPGIGLIYRRRLIEIIEHLPSGVHLLVAPAGYGKTTLIQQFGTGSCDHEGHSANDRGPGTWTLHTRNGPIAVIDGDVAARPGPEQRGGRRDQTAFPSRSLWISREHPDWATPRHLVHNLTVTIGIPDLSFTLSECMEAAAQLDVKYIRALYRWTDGWPALFMRLASAGRHYRNLDEAVRACNDYIDQEVLSPPDLNDLNWLLPFGAVGDKAFHQLRTQAPFANISALDRLPQTLHLDAIRGVRLNPLVRTRLKQRLLLEGGNQALDECCSHLLLALVRIGCLDDAFTLCECRQSPRLVDTLLRESGELLLAEKHIAVLEKWLAHAAEVASPLSTRSLLLAHIALRKGDFRSTRTLSALAAETTEHEDVRARALYLHGLAAHLEHDHRASQTAFKRAAALTGEPSLQIDATYGYLIGSESDPGSTEHQNLSAFRSQGTESARATLRLAIANYTTQRLRGSVVGVLAMLLDAAPALRLVDDPLLASSTHQAIAYVSVLEGLYEEALSHTNTGLAIAHRSALNFALPHLLLTRAQALIGTGAGQEAERLLREAETKASTDTSHAYIRCNAAMLRGRERLSRNDPEAAHNVLIECRHRRIEIALESEYLATQSACHAARGETSDYLYTHQASADLGLWAEARSWRALATALSDSRALSWPPEIPHGFRAELEAIHASGVVDSLVIALRLFDAMGHSSEGALQSTLGAYLESNHAKALNSVQSKDRDHFGSLKLTSRETQIASLLVDGLRTKEVATLLGISSPTAKLHIHNVYRKIGARSRAEAVSLLLRYRL